MATTKKTAGKSSKKNLPVTQEGKKAMAASAMAATLLADSQQNQTFAKEDVAIPFLRVLQSNSPQVTKGEPAYIKGASAGEFINTGTQKIYDGDTGILVVPAAFTPSFIEWKIRQDGGGIVKDHGADGALLAQTKKDDMGRDRLLSGTQLVRSALYYVLLIDEETGDFEQVAFSLQSTQLKKARAWNTLIMSLKAEAEGQRFNPAMFFMAYRVTTVGERNDKGSWYGVKIEYGTKTLELPGGDAIYLAARDFKQQVLGGVVKVKHEDETIVDAEIVGEDEGEDKVPF